MANLSLDDFVDSKVKHNIFKQSSSPDTIRHELDLSFEKGFIDRPLYESAIEQLNDVVEKASKGEGSKGGKIIGHTKSGKPVYQGKSGHDYKDFSEDDHRDAARFHESESSKYINKQANSEQEYYANRAIARHHNQQHGIHTQNAYEARNKEQKASLSDDEKKIIRDQKKKDIEHHSKNYEYHIRMISEAKKIGDKLGIDSTDTIRHHSYMSDHHKSNKERLEKE